MIGYTKSLNLDFPGWHLIGRYPECDDGVGSWLLEHRGQAALIEIPPGLSVRQVKTELIQLGNPELRLVTASHDHEDHFDRGVWARLQLAFIGPWFLRPYRGMPGSRVISLRGEPLYLINAPKHSKTDTVIVFRGVAMTGDIELGQLASVNDEVPDVVKRLSMQFLSDFERCTGYKIHTIISAHLNDLRTNVDWPSLFSYETQPCSSM